MIYCRKYINMQLNAKILVDDMNKIPFNIVVTNNGFTYSDGDFIANSGGIYLIVYHINVEGSITSTTIATDIYINEVPYHTSLGNSVQNQYSGSTIVKLNSGDKISLVNSTNETIEISFANITITN